MYDGHPGLRVIFTASSMLNIVKGEAYLSRRALTRELSGLSFREYLQKARMLNLVERESKGTAALQKPDKIYLENINLSRTQGTARNRNSQGNIFPESVEECRPYRRAKQAE